MVCNNISQKEINKGWIVLAQNGASRGYKHNEHTFDLYKNKMHTVNTNTHTQKETIRAIICLAVINDCGRS